MFQKFVSRRKSIILTCNRLNWNPSINFKTITPFAKSTVNKNGQEWTFIQSSIFIRETQAGDTHLPIRNKAELETGSHFQLPTEKQTRQRCLCFHSVYRLYLRPNTVPSRWDTVGAPGDFSPGRQTQPRGQAALPLRTIPRLTRRGGVRAPPKGTCPETLEHTSPSLPPG